MTTTDPATRTPTLAKRPTDRQQLRRLRAELRNLDGIFAGKRHDDRALGQVQMLQHIQRVMGWRR